VGSHSHTRSFLGFSCTGRLHVPLPQLVGGPHAPNPTAGDRRRNMTRLMARVRVAATSSTQLPQGPPSAPHSHISRRAPAPRRATHPPSPPPDPSPRGPPAVGWRAAGSWRPSHAARPPPLIWRGAAHQARDSDSSTPLRSLARHTVQLATPVRHKKLLYIEGGS